MSQFQSDVLVGWLLCSFPAQGADLGMGLKVGGDAALLESFSRSFQRD